MKNIIDPERQKRELAGAPIHTSETDDEALAVHAIGNQASRTYDTRGSGGHRLSVVRLSGPVVGGMEGYCVKSGNSVWMIAATPPP